MLSRPRLIQKRTITISLFAILIAFILSFIAQGLIKLIWFLSNLLFFHELSFAEVSPTSNNLGVIGIFIPALGGLAIGLIARFGTRKIQGHGIPEVMEQILQNDSRIAPKVAFLKPLSSVISIGTGGPFGAEGPIIATGGALGSVFGQYLRTTADERKTLLASGAAAGLSAIFGSPFAAVLIAIELLLFEFRPRSIIPVALAASTAAGVRIFFHGNAPVFEMTILHPPGLFAILTYMFLGIIFGAVAVLITKSASISEKLFEKIPIHWMFWPAIGGLVVGITGYWVPEILGSGYNIINDILSNKIAMSGLLMIAVFKFFAWSIATGSQTSGGTLAPIFIIGGSLGGLLGNLIDQYIPALGVYPRMTALVGMAAVFAGCSRSPLASIALALETTLQPLTLIPVLGGCSIAYLMSCLLMKESIMTQDLSVKGIYAPSEYEMDILTCIGIYDIGYSSAPTIDASYPIDRLKAKIERAKNKDKDIIFFITENEKYSGQLKKGDILSVTDDMVSLKQLLTKDPLYLVENQSLRYALDQMTIHGVNKLPVVNHAGLFQGLITVKDIMIAYGQTIYNRDDISRNLNIDFPDWLKKIKK
jgi:H+/Cl- antiporter ClcA